MYTFPSVSTFKFQLPVKGHVVGILLHFFCGKPGKNNKKKYSYSIVGKISGLKNTEATVDIISDYSSGGQIQDHLLIQQSQFIFSNQSLVPAGFQIKLRLKGVLPLEQALNADLGIQLKYTLKQIQVIGITSRHAVKEVRVPGLLLMQ